MRLPSPRGSDNDYSASFYIINFDEGGFSVVSADERAADVYALSNKGRFDVKDNPALDYYMQCAAAYQANKIINNPWGDDDDDNDKDGDGIWDFLPNDSASLSAWLMGDEYYYVDTEVTRTEPFYLINTTWHQESPYNDLCFTTKGEKAKAGCAPIAMAQIMAYHKKPESHNGHVYQWDLLTQNSFVSSGSPAAENVAMLVNDIGKAVGTTYKIDESPTKTKNIASGFRQFGYRSARLVGYDHNKIMSALDRSHPVYVRGENGKNGHAWVVDGYYRIDEVKTYYDMETKRSCGSNRTVTVYLHCNWGWNLNDGDGFFLSGVFDSVEGTYNQDLKMIEDIY